MGKRNVFRLDLNESREGFCRRGRGRLFHVEGPKTEKVRGPTAERLVQGIWRLRVSEAEHYFTMLMSSVHNADITIDVATDATT